MSDWRPATARIPLEGAKIELDSFGPFILPGPKPVALSDGSRPELVLQGLLDVEESWENEGSLELLRGAFVPSSVSLEVIG